MLSARLFEKIKANSKEVSKVIAANKELPIICRFFNDEKMGDTDVYVFVTTAVVTDYLVYDTVDGEQIPFADRGDFVEYIQEYYSNKPRTRDMTDEEFGELVKRKVAEWDNEWRKVVLVVCKDT